MTNLHELIKLMDELKAIVLKIKKFEVKTKKTIV